MAQQHRELLETLARGFGDLLPKVVFSGAITLHLYVDQQLAPEVRADEVVDCIANTANISEFLEWKDRLVNMGFVQQKEEGMLPGRRWIFGDIQLNLFPLSAEIAGFHNAWFEEALFHSQQFDLGDACSIRVFSPVYYLAAKLDALFDRSSEDLRNNPDFEDLIYLLDNRRDIIEDCRDAFFEVRQYIGMAFQKLLDRPDLDEGIQLALPYHMAETHLEPVLNRMYALAEINSQAVSL